MSDARRITLALKGRWCGTQGVALCPAHDDRQPSLSLTLGTDGRLLAFCHAGCEFTAIMNALHSLGLLDGRGLTRPVRSEVLERLDYERRIATRKREDRARACWSQTERIAGTPAETYLRSRGISCALPPTLRFDPGCWHQSGFRLPAMVALVEGAKGFAVLRTYLRLDGSDKASVKPNKAMLGPVSGGAVRLTMALTCQQSPLVVAEGIETALSLTCGLLSGPATIWAALSVISMENLRLPPEPGRLAIAVDGDNAGLVAAYKLASRAQKLGWRVSLLPAPEGMDWNDVLQLRIRIGEES